MTNGGGRAARAGHLHQKLREAPPPLVIGHWSLPGCFAKTFAKHPG
jgi:hypothetical protein